MHFFFLSGYLAIYHYKEQSILTSIKKKWIRLYPTYWVCLLLSAIITFIYLKERWCGFSAFLINLTMFQSLFGVASVDGAYWTLWPELVFYFYVAIWQKKKFNFNSVENICLIWIMLAFTGKLISFSGVNGVILSKILNKIFIVNYIIPFMVGVSCALELKSKKSRKRKAILFFSFLYLIITGDYISPVLLLLAYLFVYLSQNTVNNNTQKNTNRKKIGSFIAYISSITYPFYLLHQNIGYSIIYFMERKGLRGIIIILVPLCIVLMISIIIHEAIDKRLCLHLKHKLNA